MVDIQFGITYPNARALSVTLELMYDMVMDRCLRRSMARERAVCCCKARAP